MECDIFHIEMRDSVIDESGSNFILELANITARSSLGMKCSTLLAVASTSPGKRSTFDGKVSTFI